jgi:beta-glucosidase
MRRDPKSSRGFTKHFLGVISFALLSVIPGLTVADETILSNGVPSDGNVVLIGDKKMWDTVVGEEPISSASGYLSVRSDVEQRAMRASWNGKGEAQFFVAHENPRDYSAHLDQNSALVLLLRLEKEPNKKVQIKMGCGYPCDSTADLTKLLKALPPEQCVRLSFDRKCFADGGLNIKNVDTPMLITTKGDMSLSIADISVVPGLGPEATIRCR